MGKREVRRYLIRYHTLGPMLLSGGVFLAVALLASVFVPQAGAFRLRVAGVALFGIFVGIGLVQTVLVLLKTAKLDQD